LQLRFREPVVNSKDIRFSTAKAIPTLEGGVWDMAKSEKVVAVNKQNSTVEGEKITASFYWNGPVFQPPQTPYQRCNRRYLPQRS